MKVTEEQARAAIGGWSAEAMTRLESSGSDIRAATLVAWAIQELSRRIPHDDGPITAEWCRENGAEYIPSRQRWRWWVGECNVSWSEVDGVVTIAGACRPSISTRSQLLALLAALKGGTA